MKLFISEDKDKKIVKWNDKVEQHEIDSKYVIDALSYQDCDVTQTIKKIMKKAELGTPERADIAVTIIDKILKNSYLNFLEKSVLNAAREILLDLY